MPAPGTIALRGNKLTLSEAVAIDGGLHSGGGMEVNDGSVAGNTAREGGGSWTSSTLTVGGTAIRWNRPDEITPIHSCWRSSTGSAR